MENNLKKQGNDLYDKFMLFKWKSNKWNIQKGEYITVQGKVKNDYVEIKQIYKS